MSVSHSVAEIVNTIFFKSNCRVQESFRILAEQSSFRFVIPTDSKNEMKPNRNSNAMLILLIITVCSGFTSAFSGKALVAVANSFATAEIEFTSRKFVGSPPPTQMKSFTLLLTQYS